LCYRVPFRSYRPGPATLELGHITTIRSDDEDSDDDDMDTSLQEKQCEILSQAYRTIRNHPGLTNVKHLHIKEWNAFLDPLQLSLVAEETMELFRSMGPLDKLTLTVSDLQPYFPRFFCLPGPEDMHRPPNVYPPIKEFTIAYQSQRPLGEHRMSAIAQFAESQHALGVPFERMIFRMKDPPVTMAERLRRWVGAVDFYEELTAVGEQDHF